MIMWLSRTKEEPIENVLKLLGCGIFDFFLQILWMFNNDSFITKEVLKGICVLLETLKGKHFKNERAFLLNKMSEFNCERLFNEIMEDLDEYIIDMVKRIRRNLQEI